MTSRGFCGKTRKRRRAAPGLRVLARDLGHLAEPANGLLVYGVARSAWAAAAGRPVRPAAPPRARGRDHERDTGADEVSELEQIKDRFEDSLSSDSRSETRDSSAVGSAAGAFARPRTRSRRQARSPRSRRTVTTSRVRLTSDGRSTSRGSVPKLGDGRVFRAEDARSRRVLARHLVRSHQRVGRKGLADEQERDAEQLHDLRDDSSRRSRVRPAARGRARAGFPTRPRPRNIIL